MARYTDDSREKVRDAVDFVDLVGSRVELRRAGVRRYQGLCPFHEERSPSFGIDPVEKLYHCFGCGAGGDVFKWVMELEHVGFGEALEILADRYNVALERVEEDPRAAQRRARRDRLHALLERTAAYYVRLLWESGEAAGAREYLASRGLSEATAREFRVGFAPVAWDRVVVASGRAGFTADELLAAGLAQRARSGPGLVDRFHGRLMFPWADARGRVIGFGARALTEGQQPKYLNSSEGEVFSKGRHVYGVDLARAGAARAGSVVLVEGYTDVIALHQAGISHAVGQMGTALTADQAGELAKLAPTVLLCLDADTAGQNAMLKAASVVRGLRQAPELRVVALPAGADPADVVAREGAEAMRERLGAAVPFARWQVDHALRHGDLGSAEGRDRLLAEVGPVVRGLPPSMLREELIQLVAGRLGLSELLVATSLRDGGRPAVARPRNGNGAGHHHARGAGGRDSGRGYEASGKRGFDATDRGAGAAGIGAEPRGGVRTASLGAGRGGEATDPRGFDPVRGRMPPSPDDPGSTPAEAFGQGAEIDAGVDALLAADPGRDDEGGRPRAPAAPAPRPVSSNPALAALDRRSETELAFLVLCVALPSVGAVHLAGTDLDALFSGAVTRRAAAHLRDHAGTPAASLPPDDEPLAALIAEIVVRAGAIDAPAPAELDRAALMLDLARLDRDIAAARASQDPVSDLAAERQRVLLEIRKVSH